MNARKMDPLQNVKESLEQPAKLIENYPLSAMLLLFGVGLGVGVLVIQAALPKHQATMGESLGQKFHDAVASVLPQDMARKLPF